MENPENADPLVSICIPVYNSDSTIGRTIETVIGQTYRNLEIIVVDNRSTDETLARVRKFNDPRIRIVENPEHFSCAEYNWNTCFAHARGKFIALFHADDMYSPDCVTQQVEIFTRYPRVTGVFTNGVIIDESDTVTDTFRLPPVIRAETPYAYGELLRLILEYNNFLLCPSAMIRSEIYRELAPFRYDRFGSASDLDMWLRVAKKGPVMIITENLLKYRISKNQWSFTLRSRTTEENGFKVLDQHIRENHEEYPMPGNTLGKYELRRMEDNIFCALNFVKKHDFSGFLHYVYRMTWGKYFSIILTKPRISIPVIGGGFLKLVRNLRQETS